MRSLRLSILLSGLLVSSVCKPTLAISSQTALTTVSLKIAQVDWCPQICIDEDKPGYIIELLNKAFQDSEFSLVYATYPWSRAISHTVNGQAIALLAAAPNETPDLIYPTVPIGEQQACFYALPSSGWRYISPRSIEDIRIGLPGHISLEELNDYKKRHPKLFHIQANTPRYIDLSINMLKSDRLDSFIFFRNTMIYHMKRSYPDNTVAQVGCVSSTPVYIVFSPTDKHKALREKAIAHYEKSMRKIIANGDVTAIMERYGLPDWSSQQ